MGLFVNTNVTALTAGSRIFDANIALEKSFERLSSGLRINSAADDAAGVKIVDAFESQMVGLRQGLRNANDGISLLQSAEGALQESTTALQRIRVLAVQAQSGINNSADRAALQQEVAALTSELSRIGSETQFAGFYLLNGSYSATFQIGANAGQSLSINLSRTGGYGASGLGVGGISVATDALASAALTAVDTALSSIGRERADIGATENRFQSLIRNFSNTESNLASARTRIEDADYAGETATLTRNQIILQAGTAILSQANNSPQIALQLLG
ncbi:MAG: flagellin [Aestuariibacter sp.]